MDALCEPPQSFTYGGVVAHVLSFGAVRREMLASVLHGAGRDRVRRATRSSGSRVCQADGPMRETTPTVHLIARPSLDLDGMRAYLDAVGGAGWLDRRLGEGDPNPGELLVEFGGRACYRSWEPGLNPNVTRVRPDPAEYLGNILASAPRQRARARELHVRAARRLARVHPRAGPPPGRARRSARRACATCG